MATYGSTLDRQKSNSKDQDLWGGHNEGMRYRDDFGFLTRDPAGMIDGPNEYCYVRQNPWTKFDPEGLRGRDQVVNKAGEIILVPIAEKLMIGGAVSYGSAKSIEFLESIGHSVVGRPEPAEGRGGVSSNSTSVGQGRVIIIRTRSDEEEYSLYLSLLRTNPNAAATVLLNMRNRQMNPAYKKELTSHMPYSDPEKRPAYGKGQVDKVWDNAPRDENGNVTDPNTGEVLNWDKTKSRAGQWDMGHKPGFEYETLHNAYLNGKITLEEFLQEYRDPNNYQPESPSANRSHKYEQKSPPNPSAPGASSQRTTSDPTPPPSSPN